MTRGVDRSTLTSELGKATEERRVRDYARRVFGLEPESVQLPKRGGGLRGLVCYVRIRFGMGDPVEFIFADGALLGIPPKNRG